MVILKVCIIQYLFVLCLLLREIHKVQVLFRKMTTRLIKKIPTVTPPRRLLILSLSMCLIRQLTSKLIKRLRGTLIRRANHPKKIRRKAEIHSHRYRNRQRLEESVADRKSIEDGQKMKEETGEGIETLNHLIEMIITSMVIMATNDMGTKTEGECNINIKENQKTTGKQNYVQTSRK